VLACSFEAFEWTVFGHFRLEILALVVSVAKGSITKLPRAWSLFRDGLAKVASDSRDMDSVFLLWCGFSALSRVLAVLEESGRWLWLLIPRWSRCDLA